MTGADEWRELIVEEDHAITSEYTSDCMYNDGDFVIDKSWSERTLISTQTKVYIY